MNPKGGGMEREGEVYVWNVTNSTLGAIISVRAGINLITQFCHLPTASWPPIVLLVELIIHIKQLIKFKLAHICKRELCLTKWWACPRSITPAHVGVSVCGQLQRFWYGGTALVGRLGCEFEQGRLCQNQIFFKQALLDFEQGRLCQSNIF